MPSYSRSKTASLTQHSLELELERVFASFQAAYKNRYVHPIQGFYLAASYLHSLALKKTEEQAKLRLEHPHLFAEIIKLAERLKTQTRLALPSEKVKEIECAIVCHTWIPFLRKLIAYQMLFKLLPYGLFYNWWNKPVLRMSLIMASLFFPPLLPVVIFLWRFNPLVKLTPKLQEINEICGEKLNASLSHSEIMKEIQKTRMSLSQLGCEVPKYSDDLCAYLEVLQTWLQNYLMENQLIEKGG